MGFSRPSEQFDPETLLQMPGQYVGKCVRVKQGLPNYRYPTGKKMIAIEFAIISPDNEDTDGKITSILCAESLYYDKVKDRDSHYLAHAKQMGIANPLKGFDPQRFVGKMFSLVCEQQNGRVYVAVACPYVDPEDAKLSKESPPSYRSMPDGGKKGDTPF